VTIGSVTNNADGTYTATITSAKTAGPVTITATDTSVTPNINGTAPLTLEAAGTGPASKVSLALNPTSILANGTSTTTATATVQDTGGNKITGDTIKFSANPSTDVTIGSVTNNADGTYTATITSAKTAGPVTITATDTSVTPNITGTAPLTLNPGPAASVNVVLNPTSIAANGTATSTATATVEDANGNKIAGDTIKFSANPSTDVTIGSVTNNADGTYTATITSAKTAGPVTITATDTSVTPNITGNAPLTLGGTGPASKVSVVLNPTSILANGTATSTATATVEDAGGNKITGDTIKFSANPSTDVTIGSVTNNVDGTYTATITSAKTAGPVTITATDSSITTSTVGGSAQLTLEAASNAYSLAVSVNPVAIDADGGSYAFATALVTAADGTAIPGDSVQFYVNAQSTSGPCITDSNGECHITLTSSTVPGFETITATDTTAGLLSDNSVELTFVQPSSHASSGSGSSSTSSSGGSSAVSPSGASPSAGSITTATSGSGKGSAGPSASRIKTSLGTLLKPSGSKDSIRALLASRAYAFTYQALEAGRLTVDWYHRSGKHRELIGSVTLTATRAEKLSGRLRLTAIGRSLLRSSKSLSVTSSVSFAAGGALMLRTANFTLR
jgi:adhesin/invasin